MSDYRRNDGFSDMLRDVQQRISALERDTTGLASAPQYTTAGRPAAASYTGSIIFNTTTGKHEGSDGATWNALY